MAPLAWWGELYLTLLGLTFPTLGETNLLTAYLHGSNTDGTSTQ
jgi:hypothetical protein